MINNEDKKKIQELLLKLSRKNFMEEHNNFLLSIMYGEKYLNSYKLKNKLEEDLKDNKTQSKKEKI